MSRNLHAEAEESKTKGNECLANKDFDTAIQWYTQALDFAKNLPQPENNRHVYYSNRSAAYLSKGFADSALKDAELCIKEKPDWPKGYGRKGAALHFKKDFAAATKAYEQGLEVAPQDASLFKGLEEVKNDQFAKPSYARAGPSGGQQQGGDDMMNQLAQVFSAPDAFDKLRANGQTSAFMQDAQFVRQLEMVQQNPALVGQLIQTDKRFIAALSVLMGMPVQDEAEAEEQAKQRKLAEQERARKQEEQRKQDELDRETPEQRQLREQLVEANACKERGNALYKKKDFAGAMAEYDQAIALVPTEMTFYLNKASVYMEQQQFDLALEACDKAVEVGRANGAKYETLAKAFERRGNCYVKQQQPDKALVEFQKAQLECRSNDVDQKIAKLLKTIKLQKERDYVNPALGLEANQRGHALLAKGDFPAAAKEMTEAIARDPTNAQFYCDRSLAYTKLMDFGRAQEDVEKTLELDPTLVAAYARRGKIETFTKRFNRALESYRKGLQLDPKNFDCLEGLRVVEDMVQKQARAAPKTNSRGEMDEEDKIRQQRAMEDPEIRSIMQDPVMMQVLRDLGSDPKSAQKHLSNPDVAQKIEKLIAAGIVRTG